MNIRNMTIADYNEVYALWTSTPGMGMHSLDDSYEGIRKYLKRNPDTSFVAEIDHIIVGVILCGHDGRRGFIYHTAVNPDYRKKGIGKALVTAALDALRNEGINKAVLVVFRKNELGNTFWKSIGFNERDDLVYRNISLNEKN